MSDEAWNEARLIPVSGIKGVEEQERRATSALLAVMGAVDEFGRSLTRPLGAPAGRIETYIEVPFAHGDGRFYPDGLIRVRRGKTVWTALVEVKTGKSRLDSAQLERYLEIAKDQGFDCVITISNEIPSIPGQHPTRVDKRKLRRVNLFHMSWTKVLTEAVMQKEFRGVADPDQAWILSELIRYLEHDKSGAMEFDDMGDQWVQVRSAVRSGTLRPGDKGVEEVAARFDALLRFVSLRLGKRLGTEVTQVISRKELADPTIRTQSLLTDLVERGVMTGGIRIPGTVGDLEIAVDLRGAQITCSVDIDAPQSGRATTRVNWLLRQLRDASGGIRVESHVVRGRGVSAAELLSRVRENPALLVVEPTKELKTFKVAAVSPMGTKRGSGRGSFIDSLLQAVDDFYTNVLQRLKAWSAAPPRLRPEPAPDEVDESVAEELVSTEVSSQDGPVSNEGGAP